MKKYKIELNETQLILLERITDLYCRIGLQQYREIFEHINNLEYLNCNKKFAISHEDADKLVQELRILVNTKTTNKNLFRTNTSRGINNNDTPKDSKIACDIYQVLRYIRSWANAEHLPEERNQYFTKYMTVNYDSPGKYSEEPLPKCTEIKDFTIVFTESQFKKKLCELAYNNARDEFLEIYIDKTENDISYTDENGVSHYVEDFQNIFNRWYDYFENILKN